MGPSWHILAGSLVKSPEDPWLSIARTPGVELTRREECNLAQLLKAAWACGSRWLGFTRVEDRPSGKIEQRLVCKARCGTRGCPPCDRRIRERQAFRMEGDYSLFLTLGVPREAGTVAECHRKMRGWITALTRELRREAACETRANILFPERAYEQQAAENDKPERKGRPAALLQYAWAVEPHKSFYPHLHIAVNAHFVCYDWLRRLWSRIVGKEVRWIKGKKVYSQKGLCKYLAKYLSKAEFPIDLCAIWYRRRLWASTGKAPEKVTAGWVKDETLSQSEADIGMQVPEEWAADGGWEPVMLKTDIYAIWERPWCEHKEKPVNTSENDEEIHLERLFGRGWTPDVSIELVQELAIEYIENQKRSNIGSDKKESYLLYETTG